MIIKLFSIVRQLEEIAKEYQRRVNASPVVLRAGVETLYVVGRQQDFPIEEVTEFKNLYISTSVEFPKPVFSEVEIQFWDDLEKRIRKASRGIARGVDLGEATKDMIQINVHQFPTRDRSVNQLRKEISSYTDKIIAELNRFFDEEGFSVELYHDKGDPFKYVG